MSVAAGRATVLPSPAGEPAGFGRRVVAYLLDRICILAVAVVFGGVGACVADLAAPVAGGVQDRTAWAVGSLAVVGVLAGGLGVGLLQGSAGSPGMVLMRIRLVRTGSIEPIGFARALWRGVVLAATSVVVVGIVSPLFDRGGRRRGWHDLASGAWMVGTSRGQRVPAADERTRPAVIVPEAVHVVRTRSGEEWEFHTSILLGRDPEPVRGELVEVVARMGDEQRSVSRTHALLMVGPAGLVVEDRGSANGTSVVVGGTLRDVDDRPIVLPPGATLRLGDVELTVDGPRR